MTTQGTPETVVLALFAAIDSGDLQGIGALVADDIHFRFGNADATDGRADFESSAGAFLGAIADVRHEIHQLWQVETDTVICVMDVHYRLNDGQALTLPCSNLFRVRDRLVHDYRIYMDPSPVLG